jgi:hypothetical protein
LYKAFRVLPLALLALLAARAGGSRELPYERPANVRQPVLALDHVWVAVGRGGATERAMLEAAGFRFSPTINRHDGQGTASSTIDFENGHIELIWADPDVPASESGDEVRQRFAARADWRRSGQSPFGIGFRRTAATPATWPFETWSVGSAWMGEGRQLEILSPRGAPTVTLFVPPTPVDVEANRAAIAAGGPGAERFVHSNGTRRLTGVKVSAPTPAGLPPASSFVNSSGAAELIVGREWLMEVEIDYGAQNQSLDLRPQVPLIVRF